MRKGMEYLQHAEECRKMAKRVREAGKAACVRFCSPLALATSASASDPQVDFAMMMNDPNRQNSGSGP